MKIPADAQFAFADLVCEHWVHRDSLQPWLDRRWAWLAMHAYHLWFALATLPGCIAVAVVQGLDRRTAWPIIHAPLGWLAGTSLGYMLYGSLRADYWPLAVVIPSTFGFLVVPNAGRPAACRPTHTHTHGPPLRP